MSASLAISDNGKSKINSETREPLMADSAPGINIQFVPKNALIVFSSALNWGPKLSEAQREWCSEFLIPMETMLNNGEKG